MDEFQNRAIEEILRGELGRNAKFRFYGRNGRTPMTFVLDEVERQLGAPVSVFWVDDGPPEVFCLSGFSSNPIVFSTRYLSLTAFFRHLFVEQALKNVLADVAERSALKVMAEMALRYGDPDYATQAFVKSVSGKGIWLDDGDRVMQLEYEPKNHAYMATWFYGLVHEVGHFHPTQAGVVTNSSMFSDSWLLHEIEDALTSVFRYPDAIKEEAIKKAKNSSENSVLSINQIRNEGLADIFAASVLFKNTYEIMEIEAQDEFDVGAFYAEMAIFLNVVAIIDRCKRVAMIASSRNADREASLELGLHPVSVFIRLSMQRHYIEIAASRFLFGDNPTEQQEQAIFDLFDKISGHFAESLKLVDSGTARAMNFSLYPEQRENEWVLLEAFRRSLSESSSSLIQEEAQRFCALAASHGKESKLLKALNDILLNPNNPVRPDPRDDLVYLVPWVAGPDDYVQPFALNTRYGRLVFAFLHQDELFESFFNSSAAALKEGYTLKKVAVPVPRWERLAAR